MDEGLFASLDEWARLETHHHAVKGVPDAADLAAQALAEQEAVILRLRPISKAGGIAQVRFIALHLERKGSDEALVGALRHVCDTLGRTHP